MLSPGRDFSQNTSVGHQNAYQTNAPKALVKRLPTTSYAFCNFMQAAKIAFLTNTRQIIALDYSVSVLGLSLKR